MNFRKVLQKRRQPAHHLSSPNVLSGSLEIFRYGLPIRSLGNGTPLLLSSVLIVFATFLLPGCSSSNQTETSPAYQCYYDYVNAKAALPEFDAKLFWSPDSTGQRLDVYVSVRESRLQFDKDSSLFVSSYSCSIHISGNVPLSKEVDRKIVLNSYPKSDQNSYDAFLVSFPISSEEHTVQISVTDNESRMKSTKSFIINIPQMYGKPLLLGGIMFLARYDTIGTATKITPFILSNAGLLSDTLNFFTVLSSKKSSEDSVFFHVYKIQSREPVLPTFNVRMYASQPLAYNPCKTDIDTILIYKYAMVSGFSAGTSFVFGSVPKPPPGNFLLMVEVKDHSGESSSTNLMFGVHDKGFPQIYGDPKAMVNSLNYIAAPNEMRKIIAGRADSSVRANLIEFWKEHGGLDKMAQYYQRVSQANQFFTNCIEGWRTPMGMYYIVCGPPDNVDCDGEWDERWNYYQSSTQGSMTVEFRLAEETLNIYDRFYRLERVYSNADLWDYYVNRWRTPY
jgi:GWxTD domain-containing protein